jgi:hypothetical protein
MDQGLDRAREAHRRQAWADAFARFSAADEVEPLDPADLELAAEAADLAGRGDDAIRLLRRAYLPTPMRARSARPCAAPTG